MDYQKFLSSLPSLYDNWGQDSVRPKSNQFQQILEQVEGMTTANVMQLLNFAVDCMEPDEIYCQIGCFNGANLIGALLKHPNQMAYVVDNFSDFDPDGESFNKLIDNLSAFGLEEQVFVCNQDWEEFLFELRAIETENKISLYFFNAAIDYRAQILALLLVRPYLAEQALIIIGNSNKSAVKQAAWDFMTAHPQAQTLLDWTTPEDSQCTFWNGIQILSWDSERNFNYEFSEIKNQRNVLLIKSISNCSIELEETKKALEKLLREEAIDLDKSGSYELAENKYKELLKWNKNQADVLFYLGMLYDKTNRYQQALDLLIKSAELEPSKALQHYHIGLVLEKIGDISQAIQAYEHAIVLEPQWSAPYIDLGNIWFKAGDFEQAESNYRKAIDANPSYFGGYLNLGNTLLRQHKVDEAIIHYKQALQLKPLAQEIFSLLIVALQESGRTQEAIAVATEASQLLPKSVDLRLKKHMILPFIYETECEINFYRHRFTQGLEESVQQTSLETPEERKSALLAIGSYTNFFLQYQGKNDVELQKQYGQFVHRIMAANYPQWSQPLTMPSLSKGEKIRIGYVSSSLKNHNGAKWALGWIKNHNREKFEIYCYKTDFVTDKITQEFQLLSDTFHYIPDNLEAVCKQIVFDKLHILIFPDISMFPLITQIAGLRLAPVQCTAWGHPITSGLPTIDYYLSSDLMEPENAQEHYSEQLVRLPNIGLCYPKPVIPQQSKTRSDFQLREDAIVYLSCQSLFKYLPQYDWIFAAIAQQVSQAQFAFISFPSIELNRKFQQRLQHAFAKFGLKSEDYCVILLRQKPVDYFNLNLVSDVYLDTLSWSGGNSTMEAIACNLPIVTCPGEFMRGRHSYAILKMLGVTDTIASNEAEYVEIAVRLGLDQEWRDSIVNQMVQRHSYLFDDKTCVEALDAFFCSLV